MPVLDEYRSRQLQWNNRQQSAQKAFIAIGNARLFTAILAIALAWFIFGQHLFSSWSLLLPLAIFIALVVWHQRIIRRRNFADRAIRFYQQALNRVQDKWSGTGSAGINFKDPTHIYADDLDLFGNGSLFELLSCARTAAGEQTLAKWLLAPASIPEAQGRQQAVRELAPLIDLREEMALLGEDIKSSIDAATISAWGSAAPVHFPAPLRIAAFILALFGFISLLLKFAEIWPLWPVLAVVSINAAIIFAIRRQTSQVAASTESAAHQLNLLSLLIQRLELEQFTCPKLIALRKALTTDGLPASQSICHLNRWLELLDSSDHIILRTLEPLILYKRQIVMAIESWRSLYGSSIGLWISALAEFEALSSFAALHYERPHWSFPELQSLNATQLSAVSLSHPLIPALTSVSNSLALNQLTRLLIVSGSNMSGKSTLLRAVGLNTVLAWAGAPVCAAQLRLSQLQVAASLRASDSLQDNRSRFFAEITRLRQVVDLTHQPTPVLFLLDELLSGTNSHDRLIGATGIIRGLLAANTIGMITTHDLALAQLEEEAAFAAANVHLEDTIIEGRIEFDYHLRPGVVTHSNALELMRSIGLQI